jgi:uncharacterized protein
MKEDPLNGADIRGNNLYMSSSPYLLQHVSNPVWWQEWSKELIRYASHNNKPILVSIGYATCHWCHVMAKEAFSDNITANYLNEHFICVKVDREQRPDIDQFMMDFINRQNGRGGWPLNVFLTPSLNPVFALTYAPAYSKDSKNSFLSIAEKVFNFIERNSNDIPLFSSEENRPSVAEGKTTVETLLVYYDPVNGGFGNGQKFPSHSTLLYLLYHLAADDSPSIKTICSNTLDIMKQRGINDHLQGGIFRYCVDNEWTIPHFEKMLYDQAMALWIYSLAYSVIGNGEYRTMAQNILKCIDESFENNGFYISAHDADTDHEEGATYLWSYEQLKNELDPEEFSRFSGSYYIKKQGNFEGLNHLLRINEIPVKDIEEKLLSIRKERKQPSRDEKILCGINSLLAVAFIQAGRLLGAPELENRAASLVSKLINIFWDGNTLGHSYWNGVLQKQGFLSDAAYLLTAISMLYESDSSWERLMTEMHVYVESFKEGEKWIESNAVDFRTVYASWFDHPIPSGVGMAEFGLTRVALLTGREVSSKSYRQPFQSDFYNIAVLMSNGLFHFITTPELIPWKQIPVNSIQIRGNQRQDCYMGVCMFPVTEPLKDH